jgi:polysaccharide export outer membrane protein
MHIAQIKGWGKLVPLVALLSASLLAQSGPAAADKPALQSQASLVAVVPHGLVPDAAPAADTNFVIGNEDVLGISVWKDQELSRVIPVRTDGKISLPLIGELQASGKTPRQLQAEITEGLQAFMSKPQVTVIVQEIKSQRFNILGHVLKPGSYLLNPPTTLVDAIAIAGGLAPFANTKNIYVLRDDAGKEVRLHFNYKQAIKGRRPEQNVELRPRDTVVVP